MEETTTWQGLSSVVRSLCSALCDQLTKGVIWGANEQILRHIAKLFFESFSSYSPSPKFALLSADGGSSPSDFVRAPS